MKIIIIACATVALAACSKSDTPPAPVATETSAADLAPYKIQPGVYSYTRADGVGGINTVAADGTYSNAVTGGEVETGTWAQEGDLGCLHPADGTTKRCYRFSQPDAEGLFSGTTPEGMTVELRKTG